VGDVVATRDAREENCVIASALSMSDHTPPSWVYLARDIQLWRATLALLWPYRQREYPGYARAAATALSFAVATVRRWNARNGPGISVTAARRIATLLRSHATRATALAADWEAYAADRAATWTPPPYFRSARLAESDGWRSTKKKSRKRSTPA
jgi:hypothetical protein